MRQVQIFIDADVLRKNRPLYEFVIHKLVQENVTGATVFRSVLGFGKEKIIKRPDELFSFDGATMLITFIETEEKIKSVLNILKEDIQKCLVITHQVENFIYD